MTRNYVLVVLIAVVLLIPSAAGARNTRVNYDILSYLPEDLESSQGQRVLEEPFHMADTNMLVVENMPEKYLKDLRDKIAGVPGVSSAIWVSGMLDISVPKNIRDSFFSGESTMIMIQYDKPGASEETVAAIDTIRALSGGQCFLSGGFFAAAHFFSWLFVCQRNRTHAIGDGL